MVYLYLAPPRIISSFCESITSSKYWLGYGGIKLIFNKDNSNQRLYFMRVSSCYAEVEFFLDEEFSYSLLENCENFRLSFDVQLDSLSYSTC